MCLFLRKGLDRFLSKVWKIRAPVIVIGADLFIYTHSKYRYFKCDLCLLIFFWNYGTKQISLAKIVILYVHLYFQMHKEKRMDFLYIWVFSCHLNWPHLKFWPFFMVQAYIQAEIWVFEYLGMQLSI